MKAPISTAIAIAVGLVVLVGYFFPFPLLDGLLQVALLPWALILAAVALWIGVLNLLYVHWRKVRERQKGSIYSGVLVLALLLTTMIGVGLGLNNTWAGRLFTYVQIPIEMSLMAVLAVSLVYACVRLLYRRFNLFTVVFALTVFLVLLSSVPLPFGELPFLSDTLRPWIAEVLTVGGARGVLLGVALGTVATGLRILTGSDRPYGG
ncbi:MAG: hypothetical protein AB1345_05225 [Chloroflexota bacterium]